VEMLSALDMRCIRLPNVSFQQRQRPISISPQVAAGGGAGDFRLPAPRPAGTAPVLSVSHLISVLYVQ
jgi:hypothetical protein